MEKARPPAAVRVLRSAGLAAGLVLVLGAGFVMIFEESFIYFPRRGDVGPSPGEDIFLAASDGVRLHGWFVTHPEARFAILWFHGNAGNLEDRRDLLADLRSLPADVFALDYRGYGRSEGTPSEEGLYRDARAAYEWLRTRRPPERIVIFGKSLGGGPACDLAAQVPAAGLILQSAFTSARDMASRVMPLFPARWFMRTRFDNRSKVARIACPKLFIHSRSDEIIPFRMGEELYAAAAEPKEHAWFDGAGHNDLWIVRRREYRARLSAFLEMLER
ncbi:MAG TPA: alpha/beta hydrolase [Planctomycetota bacterium]|nr:alpha/beta hydrolase [Planctomycetota bacterium]